MTGLPQDPIFDAVGIVVWSIDVGIYDFMYSAWGWPIAEIIHFTGLCLLMAAVGMFDLRMMGLVKGISLPALHKMVPYGVLGFLLSAATGIMFVTSTPDQYLYNPAWQVKMCLLAGYPAKALTNWIFALKFACLISAALLVRQIAREVFPVAAAGQPLPARARWLAAAALALLFAGVASGKLLLYTNSMLLTTDTGPAF